ncbi:Zinc finger BED domain-containing protein 5, partial [Stegodyphus mimosarum]
MDPEQSTSTKNIKKIVYKKYNESYISISFTWNGGEMDPQPQCVVCGELLSNQSMKPPFLKRHLEYKHTNLKNKSEEYLKRKLSEFKNSKQVMKRFVTSCEKALEAIIQ